MSSNNSLTMAPPPKLSIVGAFKAAPTLVKVLAASFYLPALYLLVLTVVAAMGVSKNDEVAPSLVGMGVGVVLVLGLLFALIGFLLGKGIARGARSTWILALVLYGIGVPFLIVDLLVAVTVMSLLSVVIVVATLALLLTPAVRQHCTKK